MLLGEGGRYVRPQWFLEKQMSAKSALLVDDSRSARFVLSKLLKAHDYDVEMVDSAEAALKYLESQKPDAIFLDYQMPGMDGLEAMGIIKGNPSMAHIPVVVCSANEDHAFQEDVVLGGALGILPKPPTQEKLSAILTSVQSTQSKPALSSVVDITKVRDNVATRQPVSRQEEKPDAVAQVDAARTESIEPMVRDAVAEATQSLRAEMKESLGRLEDQVGLVLNEQPVMTGMMSKFEGDLSSLEARTFELVDERLLETKNNLLNEVASDPAVFSQMREVAEGAAQLVSSETARDISRKVAVVVSQEMVDEATEQQLTLLEVAVREAERRIITRTYYLAGGAALAAVLVSAVIQFFS